MHKHEKIPHKQIEEKAHSIQAFAAAGQSDKLLQELNSIKPRDLAKLAAKLRDEANKTSGKGLSEVKITQTANTKEGGRQQPIQISFESNSSKSERAQVFSFDVLRHKWYHSDLDQKARTIELYASDNKPAKVIDTLNSVRPANFSELERKLNEQTSQFTLGSESLPGVEITGRGIVQGQMQPTELTINNKSDHHAHVYQYDVLKHTWNENTGLSDARSRARLFANWQSNIFNFNRLLGQAGHEFADGTNKCYRFFIKMEGVTKSLESISGANKKDANR